MDNNFNSIIFKRINNYILLKLRSLFVYEPLPALGSIIGGVGRLFSFFTGYAGIFKNT